MLSDMSFCESTAATSISPWCVRRLTEKGRKLGGGVDTESLCGGVRIKRGWDLNPKVELDHPKICPECKSKLENG